jgi:hypothetical protein
MGELLPPRWDLYRRKSATTAPHAVGQARVCLQQPPCGINHVFEGFSSVHGWSAAHGAGVVGDLWRASGEESDGL